MKGLEKNYGNMKNQRKNTALRKKGPYKKPEKTQWPYENPRKSWPYEKSGKQYSDTTIMAVHAV